MSEPILFCGHHFSWPSQKVALMLELVGATYSYRQINLMQGEGRSPEYRAIGRFGQVPAIRHGDFSLCQSDAILAYLADIFGQYGGRDAKERARIAEWLSWQADMLANIARARAHTLFYKSPEVVIEGFKRDARRALDLLNEHLGTNPFVAGSALTIADIACYPAIANMGEIGFAIGDWPQVKAWLDRVNALPKVRNPGDFMPRA
ncbi:MAG TPA: glutathione S-transferase family protein [Alphaproteobacteria bacterium]|nr:glutathione S-transferase family protein [Alphaproteobacteria bacterium]